MRLILTPSRCKKKIDNRRLGGFEEATVKLKNEAATTLNLIITMRNKTLNEYRKANGPHSILNELIIQIL